MKPPRQQSLFDDDPPPESASALVAVAKPRGKLSAAQLTFNRLTERIRRGRETLATWDAFAPRFQRRVAAELKPIEDRISSAQRRLVMQLDALVAASKESVRLTRNHRRKARALLLDLAASLLEAGSDPEIEALYDRHGNISHAEKRQLDVDMAEAIVEDLFGPEATEGHEATSVEELLHHAGEKFFEQEKQAREASANRGDRSGRRRAAELKAQEAREAATLSVREIYRKLASALHPDRETDSAERERKTALMQRANQAYARNDLLGLLSLQIEIEQIDADALANMPETRIAHYNHVLEEQCATLDREIEQQVAVFRVSFDLTVRAVTPRRVEQALSARVVEAKLMLEKIEHELTRLADPQQRRAALDGLPDVEENPGGLEDLLLLAALFGDEPTGTRPQGRRRKKRKRR